MTLIQRNCACISEATADNTVTHHSLCCHNNEKAVASQVALSVKVSEVFEGKLAMIDCLSQVCIFFFPLLKASHKTYCVTCSLEYLPQ